MSDETTARPAQIDLFQIEDRDDRLIAAVTADFSERLVSLMSAIECQGRKSTGGASATGDNLGASVADLFKTADARLGTAFRHLAPRTSKILREVLLLEAVESNCPPSALASLERDDLNRVMQAVLLVRILQ